MDRLVIAIEHGPMTTITESLVIATSLGAATFGGAMFAFSGFVMHALDRAPARTAILAMQQINLSAPRPPLVLVMVGTSLLSIVTAAVDRSPLVIAGSMAFLASIFITGGFHIPRNDALAGVDPETPHAAAVWTAYSRPWQRGNHVRTSAALLGALLLVLSLVG
jgi:uncharacterized membrane protein